MKYEIYAHDFQRSFETLPKFILFGRAIPPYDVHAFPKVATLPDTEPTACQARDAKMHKVHNVEKHRQKQWCNQKAKVSRY